MVKTETTTLLGTLIGKARENRAALRTLERNRRLGRYEGRNGGGDTAWREREAERLETWIDLEAGDRTAAALVREEYGLAKRIGEARDRDETRPELAARLRGVRRELKELAR